MRLWNSIPYELRSTDLRDSGYNSFFKKGLKDYFKDILMTGFDAENMLTWSINCRCLTS